MKTPAYIFQWTSDKMALVSQNLYSFWDTKAKALHTHLERIGAGDDRYLSLSKRIERQLEHAVRQRYETKLFAVQVSDDAAKDKSSWEVHSEDLPWFFPQEEPESNE